MKKKYEIPVMEIFQINEELCSSGDNLVNMSNIFNTSEEIN